MCDFQCGMQIRLNFRILVAAYIRLHARIYHKKCTCMITMYVYVTLRPFAYIFLQLGKMGLKHEVEKRGQYAAGRWYAVILRHTGRYICSPRGVEGSAGGRLVVDFVPILEQKNDEKGYFLFFKLGSAQRCHRLG